MRRHAGMIKLGEVKNPKGRGKGTKNKVTRDIKQLILDTMAKLEKQKKSLYAVAKDKPDWFYENFLKPLIPKDLKIEESMEHIFSVTDTERAARKAAIIGNAKIRRETALKNPRKTRRGMKFDQD